VSSVGTVWVLGQQTGVRFSIPQGEVGKGTIAESPAL
jgi:hypothetical protein